MTTRRLLSIAGVFWLASFTVAIARQPTGTPWQWDLPPGFPEPKVPASNPMTVEKVALGRALFYDTRLSINGTRSCASCHKQELAFTDGLGRAVGALGDQHPRSAMSLANIAYSPVLTWGNPTQRELERQALVPMFGEDPVEMGLAGLDARLLATLGGDAALRAQFTAAFPGEPDPVTLHNITAAIASFERSLISGNAPYDRFRYRGEQAALSDAAKRGESLFFSERLECFHCHGGFNLTETTAYVGKLTEIEFFNNGLYNIGGTGRYPARNEGVFTVTGDPEDMGRFKAPTLRNIAVTVPYMHDGSLATLDDVIDHYAAGGRTIPTGPYAGDGSKNPYKSGFIKGFTLSAAERADLIAFLKSLTDETFLKDPRFGPPQGHRSEER